MLAHSKSKEEERTGNVARRALVCMRFMFMSGRKSATRPPGVRYALKPSKHACAKLRTLACGASEMFSTVLA